MKRNLTWWVKALVLYASGSIGVASAATLAQVVQETLGTNPDLNVVIAARKVADQQLNQSYAGYLPTVDVGASVGRDRRSNTATNDQFNSLNQQDLNFTVNQMIFDGFLVKNTVEENANQVKSAAFNVDSQVQDVVLRVAEAYIEVLRRQALVRLAQGNLDTHQKVFQQIELRSQSGIGRKADLDQATGRLAQARTNLMSEQSNYRDAVTNYIRVVGSAPKGLVQPIVPDAVIPGSEEAAVSIAIEYHPTLQATIADLERAKARYRETKAAYFPSVSFQLSGAHTKNSGGTENTSKNMTAALNLSYNLFRGGADRALERERAWSVEQSKETRHQTRRQIEQSTRLAWNAFTSSRAQLRYFKQYADSAEKTRKAYQQQFDIGQRTLLDLLDTANETFNARSSYTSAKYTELLGRYRVLNSIGKLTNFLEIPLPESAQYAPTHWFDR